MADMREREREREREEKHARQVILSKVVPDNLTKLGRVFSHSKLTLAKRTYVEWKYF